MHERAVQDQRDAEGNVDEAEAVEQEDARPRAGRRQPVERQQEEHQPEHRVHGLDGELGGREEQREQRHVARDGQRPERAQVAPVAQRDEREGDDDEQDGLLVNVPAEEERGVAAQRDGAYEAVPRRIYEELHQRHGLEEEREEERRARRDLGEHGERGVAHEAPGHAVHGVMVDREAEARRN